MIVENPEKLVLWMNAMLEPICNDEPPILARYIVKILQIDEAIADLKEILSDDLQMFLNDNTSHFVDRLFEAVANKEYLSMPAPAADLDLEQNLIIDDDLDKENLM